MDLKYLDEVMAANTPHVCRPPGWWLRLRSGIGKNDTWVCPHCSTVWKWRYWGYSDMCAWERVVPVGQGLDVKHNVLDTAQPVARYVSSDSLDTLWDHMEHDHGWKTETVTGTELLRLHYRCHHESMVASEHMLRSSEPKLVDLPWRVGSKVKRTVYAVVPDLGHDQHPLIGLMDTSELAQEVVHAHNRLLDAIKAARDTDGER